MSHAFFKGSCMDKSRTMEGAVQGFAVRVAGCGLRVACIKHWAVSWKFPVASLSLHLRI